MAKKCKDGVMPAGKPKAIIIAIKGPKVTAREPKPAKETKAVKSGMVEKKGLKN